MKKSRIAVIAATVLMAAICVICSGCKHGPTGAEISATVSEDTKYGSATVMLSQDEFEAVGFQLGDSCDVEFSNGYALTDIPYHNGYYVKTGEPLVCAYPGFDYICITFNNVGIWDAAALQEGDSVTIRLNEAGKYAPIQEVLGQLYSFERADYPSNESFCNYRALSGGNLAEGLLFRGASPVDNSRGRAAYTDALLESSGVKFVIDLADSQADMDGYMANAGFNSPYTAALYEDGQVALLSMGSSYQSDAYKKAVVAGFQQMLASGTDGPVYIHCMEGKDRTGFVCMLVEALAGASYDEMLADYMVTYQNYYKVTASGTPEKYDAIAVLYFDAFMEYLHGTTDKAALVPADYSADAAAYLAAGGMSDADIAALRAFICQ